MQLARPQFLREEAFSLCALTRQSGVAIYTAEGQKYLNTEIEKYRNTLCALTRQSGVVAIYTAEGQKYSNTYLLQ